MNATSYHQSYTDFYALITYTSYIYDTAAGGELRGSVVLKMLQISQENSSVEVSFSQSSEPSALQDY